jgi:hypothetical protein
MWCCEWTIYCQKLLEEQSVCKVCTMNVHATTFGSAWKAVGRDLVQAPGIFKRIILKCLRSRFVKILIWLEWPKFLISHLVPTFVDRGVSRCQCSGSPTAVNLSFLDWSRYFSFKWLIIYSHRAEWTPFQTHCYSENLVAPGIEPRTSGLAAKNSDY